MCWVDKEINQYDPRPLPRTSLELVKECTAFCKSFDTEVLNEDIKKRKYKYFIITDNEEKFLGFVNFFSIDKVEKQCEMGITIGDKRCWNKGIAYTAVKEVMKFMFNNLDIDRIYIETGEDNKAALRLFEKLYFKKCDEYLEEDGFKFIVMEKKKGIEIKLSLAYIC
jgi:RimJ/RimL family protein N-acetyltransferase